MYLFMSLPSGNNWGCSWHVFAALVDSWLHRFCAFLTYLYYGLLQRLGFAQVNTSVQTEIRLWCLISRLKLFWFLMDVGQLALFSSSQSCAVGWFPLWNQRHAGNARLIYAVLARCALEWLGLLEECFEAFWLHQSTISGLRSGGELPIALCWVTSDT